MIDKLTLPKLHDIILKNNLNIPDYKYLTKSAIISKIKKDNWYKLNYNDNITPDKNTSKYIGGYKLVEEIQEDKTIKEDFKPLKIEEEQSKNNEVAKDEVATKEDEEEEITTNVSTDKKGNIIIITYIPKNKII